MPKRLGQRIHRRGGAHGVAMADRGRGRTDDLDEFTVVDLALGQLFARLPHHRARAGALAMVPAVEHRPAREHDGRNIHRRRSHDLRRRRLVAAGGQHHRIERVAVEHLDQRQILQVAIQAGGRALAGFLNRMQRKLEGDAARLADALAGAPARSM
jgi:hypothetical protein